MKIVKATTIQLSVLALLAACGGDDGGGGGGGDTGCVPGIPAEVTAEATYCGDAKTISGSTVTVTGTAEYEFREQSALGLSNTISTRPIRFAEIQVTNSSGTVIQCAETDGSGDYSLLLPDDGATYTVSVRARADNANAKVSVLDAPDTNNFYEVTGTVTASGSPTRDLTAEAKGTIVGGAFNIYDQVIATNQYLDTELTDCDDDFDDCIPFATTGSFVPSGKTAKVEAYWKAGFNPNSYFCSDTSGLSFYSPDTDQLFILGGIDGDTDNSDTDHFDNSVIIHEYGHFLEDQYATSDSPGGSHDGNSIIDPRLAWSEGWANFIQTAVLTDNGSQTDPVYQDTSGNADGSTANFFLVNLEFRCGSGTDNETGSCVDKPTSDGEGNFREFSITRVLYDMIDGDADTFTSGGNYTDTLQMAFAEVWTAFTSLRSSSVTFRSIGDYHELRNGLTGTGVTTDSDYEDLVGAALQQPNRTDYANPIATLPGSCTTNLPSSGSSFGFNNMDFYDYDHPGGTIALDLSYTAGSSDDDMDLHLFQEDYVFSTSQNSTHVAISNETNDGGSESLSVTSLAAGNYLIVVHYFDGSGSKDYTLNLTNSAETDAKVCPETSF